MRVKKTNLKFKNVLKDVYFSGLNYKNENTNGNSKPFIITTIVDKNDEII